MQSLPAASTNILCSVNSIPSYACQACRQLDLLQSRAVVESALTNALHAFGQRDRLKAATLEKRIGSDKFQTVRQSNSSQSAAVTKSTVGDSGYRNSFNNRRNINEVVVAVALGYNPSAILSQMQTKSINRCLIRTRCSRPGRALIVYIKLYPRFSQQTSPITVFSSKAHSFLNAEGCGLFSFSQYAGTLASFTRIPLKRGTLKRLANMSHLHMNT